MVSASSRRADPAAGEQLQETGCHLLQLEETGQGGVISGGSDARRACLVQPGQICTRDVVRDCERKVKREKEIESGGSQVKFLWC